MSRGPLSVRLAGGPVLDALPGVVDVTKAVPPNPPDHVQVQFVGLSSEKAYAEAATFVDAVSEALVAAGLTDLADGRVLDFGSGWGRITRVLLAEVPAHRVYAADVDPEMTALLGVTLPGVNAFTVTPSPPTVLAGASMDLVVAFSVFSHLSASAHRAWARELARLVRPGGAVAVTVLGEEFIDLVAGARAATAAGTADDFATTMAEVFADPEVVRKGFHADRVQFGATGGGGVRTDDYYGWAVASRRCVERIWGDAGMELVRWWPSGELFPQAMALLVRADAGPVGRVVRRSRRGVRHRWERGTARLERSARTVAGPLAGRLRRALRA